MRRRRAFAIIEIRHPEASCRSVAPNNQSWEHEAVGAFDLKPMNPWRLKAKESLDPGREEAVILIGGECQMPVPFDIQLAVWTEDQPHQQLNCAIDPRSVEGTQRIVFGPRAGD